MGEKQTEVVIKDYLQKLRYNKIAIDQAILYGSHVSNTADEDSDIDLVVISSEFGRDYVNEAVRLKLLALDISPDIAPSPYSLKDYQNARKGDFLFDEVIRKGRVVS